MASETVARLGLVRLGSEGMDLELGLELGLVSLVGSGPGLGLGLRGRLRSGLSYAIPVASAGRA